MGVYKNRVWENEFLYNAKAGDTFDIIAYKAYRGNSYLASLLREVNPEYIDILVFNGGEVIKIPVISKAASELVPPWRQ